MVFRNFVPIEMVDAVSQYHSNISIRICSEKASLEFLILYIYYNIYIILIYNYYM